MSRLLNATALILSDDARDPDMLGSLLAESGYVAYSVASMDDDVEVVLHETHAALVLAHVDLKRDTLGKFDDVALLGMLQREPTYGLDHVVLVMTRTPEVVDTVLGSVLEGLGIPVLALPFSDDAARALLAEARERQRRRAMADSSQTAIPVSVR